MQSHANGYSRVNKVAECTPDRCSVDSDSPFHVPQVDPYYGNCLWDKNRQRAVVAEQFAAVAHHLDLDQHAVLKFLLFVNPIR